MPFEGEFASPIGHMDLFNDDELNNKIRSMSNEFNKFEIGESDNISFKSIEEKDIEKDISEFDKVIAIDGSRTKSIKSPNSDIRYRIVKIAIIEFKPEELPNIDMNKTYAPNELRNWVNDKTYINIPFPDFEQPEDYPSFNVVLKNILSDIKIYKNEFDTIIKNIVTSTINKEDSINIVCPSCDNQVKLKSIYQNCPECNHQLDYYSALQFYNGYVINEFMTFFENIALLDIMDSVENTLIIKDGPLAQSRSQSSFVAIKKAFQNRYSKRLNSNKANNKIIGVEKTGLFQSELQSLDKQKINAPSIASIPEDVLDDIRSSYTNSIYGKRTHFGKRFFVCPKDNALFTIYVPRLPKHEENCLKSSIEEYEPDIYYAYTCLKKFNANLFPSSITPLIIANKEASLPEDAPYDKWISGEIN